MAGGREARGLQCVPADAGAETRERDAGDDPSWVRGLLHRSRAREGAVRRPVLDRRLEALDVPGVLEGAGVRRDEGFRATGLGGRGGWAGTQAVVRPDAHCLLCRLARSTNRRLATTGAFLVAPRAPQ